MLKALPRLTGSQIDDRHPFKHNVIMLGLPFGSTHVTITMGETGPAWLNLFVGRIFFTPLFLLDFFSTLLAYFINLCADKLTPLTIHVNHSLVEVIRAAFVALLLLH